jgi:hypothetical protein
MPQHISQSVLLTDDVLLHVDDVAYVSHVKKIGFPMIVMEFRTIRVIIKKKYHKLVIEFIENYIQNI